MLDDEPILSDNNTVDPNERFEIIKNTGKILIENSQKNVINDTIKVLEEVTKEELVICIFDHCTEQNVKRCRKCNRPFCIMHCNVYSPNFCKECFKDLSTISEKFKRTFDHISHSGQLYHTTEENTRYYMDGPDWPFVTPWIHTLSDNELKTLWVFHYSIMKIIENENETRRIEYNRKQREQQPSTRLITQSGVSSSGTKTRVTKVADTPEDVRKKLKKSGIPDVIIEQMIKAMNI